MLGKVLKYEFKATARVFLLLFLAYLLVVEVNALLVPISLNSMHASLQVLVGILSSLFGVLYTLLTLSLMLVAPIVYLVRFYRMLGDEGYLWFSLPVNVSTHILGKLIPAAVWTLSSVAILFLSTILTAAGYHGFSSTFDDIAYAFDFAQTNGIELGVWISCGVIIAALSWLTSALSIFTSISIGSNLMKSRLGGSVLTFILMNIARQIVVTPLVTPVMSAVLRNLLTSVDLNSASGLNQLFPVLTLVYAVYAVILAVAYFLITRYMLSKKLNLT